MKISIAFLVTAAVSAMSLGLDFTAGQLDALTRLRDGPDYTELMAVEDFGGWGRSENGLGMSPKRIRGRRAGPGALQSKEEAPVEDTKTPQGDPLAPEDPEIMDNDSQVGLSELKVEVKDAPLSEEPVEEKKPVSQPVKEPETLAAADPEDDEGGDDDLNPKSKEELQKIIEEEKKVGKIENSAEQVEERPQEVLEAIEKMNQEITKTELKQEEVEALLKLPDDLPQKPTGQTDQQPPAKEETAKVEQTLFVMAKEEDTEKPTEPEMEFSKEDKLAGGQEPTSQDKAEATPLPDQQEPSKIEDKPVEPTKAESEVQKVIDDTIKRGEADDEADKKSETAPNDQSVLIESKPGEGQTPKETGESLQETSNNISANQAVDQEKKDAPSPEPTKEKTPTEPSNVMNDVHATLPIPKTSEIPETKPEIPAAKETLPEPVTITPPTDAAHKVKEDTGIETSVNIPSQHQDLPAPTQDHPTEPREPSEPSSADQNQTTIQVASLPVDSDGNLIKAPIVLVDGQGRKKTLLVGTVNSQGACVCGAGRLSLLSLLAGLSLILIKV